MPIPPASIRMAWCFTSAATLSCQRTKTCGSPTRASSQAARIFRVSALDWSAPAASTPPTVMHWVLEWLPQTELAVSFSRNAASSSTASGSSRSYGASTWSNRPGETE